LAETHSVRNYVSDSIQCIVTDDSDLLSPIAHIIGTVF